MSAIAIKVENVSKIYKLYEKPIDRMKEALSLTKKKYGKEHYALKDISFEVKKGETIGLIGTNGSGKSTILKLITGVLTPTTGSIMVNGKISALLELGAGFNPEYTGIENIYLNGTMMGYTREEMGKRIQSIMDFADIGEFINQPVKTYSSGMFARLAFAVAINVEPNILIVDEALSVGDVRFQMKCINKMKELKESNTTILFVSHAMEQIKRFCDKAVWIEKGNIKAIGDCNTIIDKYEAFMLDKDSIKSKDTKKHNVKKQNIEKQEKQSNNIIARVLSAQLSRKELKTFKNLEVCIEYEVFDKEIPDLLLGAAIYTPKRDYIFGPNTCLDNIEIPNTIGKHKVKYKIPSLTLLAGIYNIDVGIFSNKGIVCIDYKTEIATFTVSNNEYFTEGKFYIEHNWEVIE